MQHLDGNKKIVFWFIAVAITVPLLGYKGLIGIVKQNMEISKLNRKLADVEKENKDLKKRLNALENDSVLLEGEVKKRVGLVKPGEIKYKFVEHAY